MEKQTVFRYLFQIAFNDEVRTWKQTTTNTYGEQNKNFINKRMCAAHEHSSSLS